MNTSLWFRGLKGPFFADQHDAMTSTKHRGAHLKWIACLLSGICETGLSACAERDLQWMANHWLSARRRTAEARKVSLIASKDGSTAIQTTGNDPRSSRRSGM